MKYLLFSHGFGVQKDSKGMFTDIAKAFPGYKPVMFDYNKYDSDASLTTVYSYRKQAKIIKSQINKILAKDKNAEITIIAHSQGAIVAGLCKTKTSKAVLLAPPTTVSARRSKLRPNRKVNKNGSVMIFKKDGSKILLTTGFMLGLRLTKPLKIYERLALRESTVIIAAKQDEMVKNLNLHKVRSADVYEIDGDHNFTGQHRKDLIKKLKQIIV
jgi:hypothetical protein